MGATVAIPSEPILVPNGKGFSDSRAGNGAKEKEWIGPTLRNYSSISARMDCGKQQKNMQNKQSPIQNGHHKYPKHTVEC
jgi:hypothetical protein